MKGKRAKRGEHSRPGFRSTSGAVAADDCRDLSNPGLFANLRVHPGLALESGSDLRRLQNALTQSSTVTRVGGTEEVLPEEFKTSPQKRMNVLIPHSGGDSYSS